MANENLKAGFGEAEGAIDAKMPHVQQSHSFRVTMLQSSLFVFSSQPPT